MAPRLAGLALVLVIACGGSSKPPPAPPANEPVADPAAPPPAPATPPPAVVDVERPAVVSDEMVALADEMVVAMEDGGRAMAAVGGDCGQGAAAVRGMIARMKPLTERAKAYEEPMKDPAAEKWFQDRYMKRMTGAMTAMIELAATCSEHPDFQAAINELGQLGS